MLGAGAAGEGCCSLWSSSSFSLQPLLTHPWCLERGRGQLCRLSPPSIQPRAQPWRPRSLAPTGEGGGGHSPLNQEQELRPLAQRSTGPWPSPADFCPGPQGRPSVPGSFPQVGLPLSSSATEPASHWGTGASRLRLGPLLGPIFSGSQRLCSRSFLRSRGLRAPARGGAGLAAEQRGGGAAAAAGAGHEQGGGRPGTGTARWGRRPRV